MPWYSGLPDWLLRQAPTQPPPDLYRAAQSLGDIGAGIGALGPFLRPGLTPPSPGGAAPGAGLPTPQPVTPGAPNLGQIGAQIGAMGNWPSAAGSAALGGGPGMSGATGSWNAGQAGATGSWNPATAVPPGMAQYGLSPHSGLLGSLAGIGADIGRAGNWPNAQASGGLAGGQPPSAYYDIQPGGGSGAGAVTGDKLQPQYPGQNIPLPTRKPAPVPQRKPKPKPKRQPQGDQAHYTSKTNWQSHNEAYNPIQGNFGYQAWRKPR